MMKPLVVVAILLACLSPSYAEEVTCSCDNKGEASPNNGYSCTDESSSAFCSTNQVCCSYETVDVSSKADLCCDACTDNATCSCANPNECSPNNGFKCSDDTSIQTRPYCFPPESYCPLQDACVSESSFGLNETSEQCQFKDECKTPAPTLEPSTAPTDFCPRRQAHASDTNCDLAATLSSTPMRQGGPHGTANLEFVPDSPTTNKFRLAISVEDAEEACNNCKLYISESPECSQEVIPTYPTVYNTDTTTDDPWEDIKYSVSNEMISLGYEFDHGVDFSQYEGTAMVLEDEAGRPVICGIFTSSANDTSPTEAPTTSGATPLWKSGLFVAMAVVTILMK